MTTVDITCDLMDQDETGYIWTFLYEARDPTLITPGTNVVAGDEETQALAEASRSSRSLPVRCDRCTRNGRDPVEI